MKLRYLDAISRGPLKFKDAPLWHHIRGLSYTSSGYGSKIPTRSKVLYGGRWYRIYATCYGNASSCWIESKKERIFIR